VAWISYKHVASLASGEDCVCWPIFPGCHELRPLLSPRLVQGAVLGYIGLSLGSAVLFAQRRSRGALMSFVSACALGSAIYALDYRLRFNQVMMLAWVSLVFVAVRRPLRALQAIIALFYVWAGTLKLDDEWLSGAALYAKPLMVPAALVPAACVYVVALELGMVWGLFVRSPPVRWAVLGQLVVFHAVSWGVVGYYYPLLMLALLAVYPLVWTLAPEEALSFAGFRSAPVATTAALFSAFQLPPLLIDGDSALTGEGRLFALHMFDARIECSGGATLSQGDARAAIPIINPGLDARTRCDPIVLFGTTQRLCRSLRQRGQRARVDLAVDARRTTQKTLAPLVRVDDFCAAEPSYSIFGHNDWIVRAPADRR
jgi:hypothetical protein